MAATRGSLVVPRAMRGLFSVGRTARDLFSAGRPALRPATRLFSSSVAVSSPAHPKLLSLARLDDDAHHALAKNWLDQFTPEDIPKHAYEVSYARSSGPGGQHVNTTNSKAVVRCDIHRAKGDWLPLFVMPALQQSPHYHAPSLLIAAQASRSAPQNLAAAIQLLHATIVQAGRGLVRGQTSAAQKERVRSLAQADKRRTREMKERHKSKKAGRRE